MSVRLVNMPTVPREEVFLQLRRLADLCNSLPRPPGKSAPPGASALEYNLGFTYLEIMNDL